MNREEAIKRIRDFGLYHAIEDLPHSTKTVEAFEMAIQALEEPERKKGKWKHGCCSECGYNWGKDAPIASVPNYCPNCGAKMDKDGSAE